MMIEDEYRKKVLGILRESGRTMLLGEVCKEARKELKITFEREKHLLKDMRSNGWIFVSHVSVWKVYITMDGRKAWKAFDRIFRD